MPLDRVDNGLPVLAGNGVTLRPLTGNDAEAVFAIFSDPAVVHFMSVRRHETLDHSLAFIAGIDRGIREGTMYQWGVAVDSAIVGSCTLLGIDRRNRKAEVGFAVARAFWRRGIVTKALPLMIAFAFDELGLKRLEAEAEPTNAASIKALERAGFIREGLARERYRTHETAQDSVLLGLLETDWRRTT